jgi:beta-glucanase (GH16 family)
VKTMRVICGLVCALHLLLLPEIALGSEGDSRLDREWSLIWQDEFSGAENQSPDPAKWGYDIGTGAGGWGNNQQEYDTDLPTNVSQDGNGNLRIIAREESYGGMQYTSARIVTRDLFEPTYGKFEARIKLPFGQGIWPAFWLLGANITEVSWPQCGEIDIMEYLGHQPSYAYGTVHGPGYSGGGGPSAVYNLSPDGFHEDFHVFTIEWGVDYIHWYIDDNYYHSVHPWTVNGDWVFDHPFYMILNVAVGGHWPGYPDECTIFPQTMLIDWVRVYEEQ